MSYRIIGKTTGTVMLVEAAFLALHMIISLVYHESILPFLYTVIILLCLGLPLFLFLNTDKHFTARCAYITVVLVWIALAVFGALPFYFCGYFDSFIDCVFESMSGFTTTGSTILGNIEALPKGILLWRSFTHFLGGMGILVFATAIMNTSSDRAHHLTRAEVPGPTSDKLVPKLSESSKILYGIYILFTILQVVCLLIAGLGAYDAFNVAFATAGTGGFSVMNASVGAYNNPAVDIITSLFMILFSINFTVHFLMITGKFKQALKNTEVRFFLIFVAAAVLITTADIYPAYGDAALSFRYALFSVSSVVSTTGFSIVDYNVWPEISRMIIIILMVFGACAGSTGGGVKCSRVYIMLKAIRQEIRQIVHPRSIHVTQLDGKTLEEKTVLSVFKFFAAYIIIATLASLLISVDNYDITTTFTAVISCMSNIGPGLGLVGPSGNFAIFSNFSKIILTLCMLIGRLEIFPILIFFSPNTWKRN